MRLRSRSLRAVTRPLWMRGGLGSSAGGLSHALAATQRSANITLRARRRALWAAAAAESIRKIPTAPVRERQMRLQAHGGGGRLARPCAQRTQEQRPLRARGALQG